MSIQYQIYCNLSLHNNPEVSFEETNAHNLLAATLEDEGFTVEKSAYDLPTAFVASFSPGEHSVTIGYCAEYDALPQLGHACGHNLIAISSVGAAIALKRAIQLFNLKIRVVVYGTPGEETIGGKILMINKGGFKESDVVLMAHPGHSDMICQWLSLGVIRVEFFGKVSHAAATPWEGINALDAAVLAYQSIGLLRQQLHPTTRVHGIILSGGSRPNLIPDYSKMEFYCRAPTIQQVNVLMDKIIHCFKAAATATGCTFKTETDPTFAHVKSNNTLNQIYTDFANQEGIQVCETLEAGGSTDMGNVSQIIPGIHPMFSIGSAKIHTTEFAQMACSAEAHQKTLSICKVLGLTGLKASLPDILPKILEDFHTGN